MENQIAGVLSEAAEGMLEESTIEQIEARLESDAPSLAKVLAARCLQALGPSFDCDTLRTHVAASPYLLLKGVFQVDDLPETPADFLPVPRCKTTIRARLAALALHGLLHKETIAYRSENNGGLFVNLVAMPGEGKLAEKSTKSMRGHTDAVSFPFPGTQDPEDPRIAPSPDCVTLVGFRNPDSVPTHVIPLESVLRRLTLLDIAELEKPQFNIECQNTFARGTEAILGESHIAIGAAVLRRVGAEYWVRFSHSKVQPDDANTPAIEARERFAQACEDEQIPLVVAPGDLLIINNRRALHGRSEVKKGIGGETRWLLRTYALDTEAIEPSSRYVDSLHELYP
jgi:hypothetical protein